MSKKFKLTNHGMHRIKERTTYYKNKDIYKLFQKAVQEGKNPTDFRPPFSDYLKAKLSSGMKVKVYQRMIFIYRDRTLITSYPVPQKYIRQLSFQKRQLALLKSFKGTKNKKLRELLIQELDMFISYAQLSHGIIIYQDEETSEKMYEMWLRLKTLILELRKRIGTKEYTPDLEIDNANIIDYSRACLIEFVSLTSDYVGFGAHKDNKTVSQRVKDNKNFSRLTSELDRCIDFIHMRNYFLVQSQSEDE